MDIPERRKHPRCHEDTGILYSFFNKSERYAAVARNYSRFGMYIESDVPLAPGTTIVIRPVGCDAASDPASAGLAKGPTPYYCKNSQLNTAECREIKLLVTAQVKRCEKINDSPESYGIGVHFIEPAV